MSFECPICFERYTSPGTDHAPFSTICGHLMGKSCIENLTKNGLKGEFNCPFCYKKIKSNNYHPIYLATDDIPKVISNDTPTKLRIVKIKKENEMKKSIEEYTLHDKVDTLCHLKNDYNILAGKGNISIVEFGNINNVEITKCYYKSNLYNSLISKQKMTNNKCNDIVLELVNHSYYYGKISREVAENYLNLRGVIGDFLVRDSESIEKNYSISLKGKDRIIHYLIHVDEDYNSWTFGKKTFQSLKHLIDYFMLYPILCSEAKNELIFTMKPLPKQI